MGPRTRKLIGTVIMMILVLTYAVFALAGATAYLPADNGWAHLLYFGLTGMLWVVPAMFIIRWMIGRREDYDDA